MQIIPLLSHVRYLSPELQCSWIHSLRSLARTSINDVITIGLRLSPASRVDFAVLYWDNIVQHTILCSEELPIDNQEALGSESHSGLDSNKMSAQMSAQALTTESNGNRATFEFRVGVPQPNLILLLLCQLCHSLKRCIDFISPELSHVNRPTEDEWTAKREFIYDIAPIALKDTPLPFKTKYHLIFNLLDLGRPAEKNQLSGLRRQQLVLDTLLQNLFKNFHNLTSSEISVLFNSESHHDFFYQAYAESPHRLALENLPLTHLVRLLSAIVDTPDLSNYSMDLTDELLIELEYRISRFTSCFPENNDPNASYSAHVTPAIVNQIVEATFGQVKDPIWFDLDDGRVESGESDLHAETSNEKLKHGSTLLLEAPKNDRDKHDAKVEAGKEARRQLWSVIDPLESGALRLTDLRLKWILNQKRTNDDKKEKEGKDEEKEKEDNEEDDAVDKTPRGRITRLVVELTRFIGRLKVQRGNERSHHSIPPGFAARACQSVAIASSNKEVLRRTVRQPQWDISVKPTPSLEKKLLSIQEKRQNVQQRKQSELRKFGLFENHLRVERMKNEKERPLVKRGWKTQVPP